MDGWNTIVSFWGPAYFQGQAVSFGEGKGPLIKVKRLFTHCHMVLATPRNLNGGAYQTYVQNGESTHYGKTLESSQMGESLTRMVIFEAVSLSHNVS